MSKSDPEPTVKDETVTTTPQAEPTRAANAFRASDSKDNSDAGGKLYLPIEVYLDSPQVNSLRKAGFTTTGAMRGYLTECFSGSDEAVTKKVAEFLTPRNLLASAIAWKKKSLKTRNEALAAEMAKNEAELADL